MAFLQLQNIGLAFGDRDILDDVNFTLHADKRCALAGSNGSGKTTLLRLMAAEILPDSGSVVRSEATRVAYLPQAGIVAGNGTVYEEAERAFERWRVIENEAQELADRASLLSESEAMLLLEKSHDLREALEDSGWYRRSEVVGQTLRGLGFASRDLDRSVSTLSGGWQMRVALARRLLEKPDILLLDEPTNYLDLEAKDWLETFLKRREGGFFLVSHDRGFLDAVVEEVVEVAKGKLTVYPGNYTTYETRRRDEIERLQEAWKRQKAEIAKQEAYINRFRAQATKASGVQSRIKLLDKVELIEVPESIARVRFRFPPAPHSGRDVLTIRGLTKNWGDNTIFSGLELDVQRGTKLAVTGHNGAGKSTLMRILAGFDPHFGGLVRWGTEVSTAYFSQDHEKDLNPAYSVLEAVEAEAPTALYPKLRDLLGSFLFHGDDVEKKTSILSGGEKNRLTLVKLLLKPSNVLILDEPTNHLDLASKDVLLEALEDFEGTVFVVSHDKYFLSHLVDQVLELAPDGPHLHWGGWPDYARRLESETSGLWNLGGEFKKKVDASATESIASIPTQSISQSSRVDAKKRQAAQRRLEKEEMALLEEIDKIGEEHQMLQNAMSNVANYTDGSKIRDLLSRTKALEGFQEELQAKWENIARELESLNKDELGKG